jgi:predicted amidophosphoribosyltransferase
MFLVAAFTGLLRPASCLACGRPDAWPCCGRCLPPDPAAVGPWPLAADPNLACWALGQYRDALRTAVLAGKLHGQPGALTELGRRLGVAMAAAGVGADLVTFVAARRVAGQPRDHAERIADGIAAALALPLVDLLAPAGGRDLGRARQAAARSGRPPPPRPPPRARRRLAGGRVLLVDDVVTTGGTLAGAAATLQEAGARQVEAAALATAPAALATAPAVRQVAADSGPPASHRSRGPPFLGDPPTRAGPSRPPPGARPGPPPARPTPPRQGADQDRLCSWRSHCVVVTRFRV